jgi:cytoskeleton protein RodZ
MVDAAGGAPATGASAGQMLRAARERKGLSVQEAADGLNLKPRIIEALETDSYEQLPPRTFVKGYLRAYAKLVDVKEYDVLAAFEQQQPEQPPERMQPALTHSDTGGVGWLKWFVLAVALLLLGYLAFDAYRPPASPVVPEQPDAEAPQAPVPVVPAPTEQPAAEPQPAPPLQRDAQQQQSAEPSEPAQQAVQPTQPTAAPEQTAQAPAEVPVRSEPPVASEPAEDQRPAAPMAPLSISVDDESWIQVTDATGARRYAGLVQGPRTLRVDGAPPFDVVVGNAAAVEIRYAGERVSLPSRRPGRVLRLTVPAAQ